MTYIFFDLETSDVHPIGQILNYSFVATSPDFKILSEKSGDITISKLQLPRAGAIAANRVDVLTLQKSAKENEKEAMRGIHKFLDDIVLRSKLPVSLIGYNSNRFDVPYLRTSLIRNGLNPYFGGKIAYRDLLSVVRLLSTTNRKFPRPASKDDPARLSLSLERISQALGLLDGAQTHHSRDDVLLSIELAKELTKHFKTDLRTFEGYTAPADEKRGLVAVDLSPNYELASSDIAVETALMLLDSNHRYALWVHLEKFKVKPDIDSVMLYKKLGGTFVPGSPVASDNPYQTVAVEALNKLGKINLNNYFTTSSCDIEQDIFRLDFDGIRALYEAIWNGDESTLVSLGQRDAYVLFLRHQLASHVWGGENDKRMQKMLREYAAYRYGGKCQLTRTVPDDETRARDSFHSTLDELFDEIQAARDAKTDKETLRLMDSLEKFYRDSDIFQHSSSFLRGIRRPEVAARVLRASP